MSVCVCVRAYTTKCAYACVVFAFCAECIGHESDINSHKQWGVQVYTIKSRWIEEEVYWFIRELLCLPRPQSGHILIKQEGAEPCTVLLESTEVSVRTRTLQTSAIERRYISMQIHLHASCLQTVRRV